MTKCTFILNFLKFYNILWHLALPFLNRNKRLAPTFQRRVAPDPLHPADIWIQAASAGEAFLALSIFKAMAPVQPLKALVTATTDQGIDILKKGLARHRLHSNLTVIVDVFPFDIPQTMDRAVKKINPQVMVLLETELWPSLLHALHQNNSRILILNARMSPKSLRSYRLTRKLWQALAPDRVLATSARDAQRYKTVFPDTKTGVMDNIKFDIMETAQSPPSALARILPEDLPLSILASVRRQEENDIIQLISRLTAAVPNQVVAVFPRHMHRILPLQKKMKTKGVRPVLGSQLTQPLTGPGIILWDGFGELRAAYAHASTVFVGGSLRPLGGQNFLEPSIMGIPTVIGPHWDDFAWVGPGIFKTGGVTCCQTLGQVAQTMADHLNNPKEQGTLRQKTQAYINARTGGSHTAWDTISKTIEP